MVSSTEGSSSIEESSGGSLEGTDEDQTADLVARQDSEDGLQAEGVSETSTDTSDNLEKDSERTTDEGDSD